MVTVTYSDLLDAVEYASVNGPVETSAFIDLATGKFHYIGDWVDPDQGTPEDIADSDGYLAVPRKNNLDLGRQLVMAFVEQHLPGDYDRVVDSFHKRGAYGRFKDLLDRRDAREAWYAFESDATERALKQWCEEHGIQLSFAEPAA
jgi:hypothetical protein